MDLSIIRFTSSWINMAEGIMDQRNLFISLATAVSSCSQSLEKSRATALYITDRDGDCDSSAGKIKEPKAFYCLQVGTYIDSLAVHTLKLVP